MKKNMIEDVISRIFSSSSPPRRRKIWRDAPEREDDGNIVALITTFTLLLIRPKLDKEGTS